MTPTPRQPPFYRDARVLAWVAQVAFLLLVVLAVLALATNLRRGLQAQNLSTSFDFLGRPAGFQIAEGSAFGAAYAPGDSSYLAAFLVGLTNTLSIAVTGVVLATLLGTVMGVARLSTNWLVNRLALVYVELIRNTPLLVQLVFWYFAVALQLPVLARAARWPGGIVLSQRGVAVPWGLPTDGFSRFWPWLLVALALAGLARRALRRRERPAGLMPLAAFLAVTVAAYLLAGRPLAWSVPRVGTFGISGGLVMSPEFAALLVSLVVYTGAFIAEVVRAGIQAVPAGQVEAASALGLPPGLALRLVVLPQALRVIVPPLGNQYLNLMKNSSLAVAVGFPDLFSVATTAGNQSGNNVQAMLLILAAYLLLSLAVALAMNLLNAAVRQRAR